MNEPCSFDINDYSFSLFVSSKTCYHDNLTHAYLKKSCIKTVNGRREILVFNLMWEVKCVANYSMLISCHTHEIIILK